MSTYSAGYLNVGTLNATGVSAQLKTSTATVTNLTATNVNTTNINGITNLNLSGNIANSGNQLSGVYALQASDIAKIEEVAAGIVSTSANRVPNFFVSYGNASNSTINTKVYGTQSNGTPVPANPYIRIASETKVLGTMVAAKLLEDGYFTVDSNVDSFLGNAADAIYDASLNRLTRPWLIQNRSWIDASGNIYAGAVSVPNVLPPRVYNAGNPDCAYFNYSSTGALISGSTLDASGATAVTTLSTSTRYGYGPIVNFYNAVNGTSFGPSNPLTGANAPVQMTIRHLLSMTAGLDYDFWNIINFAGALQFLGSNQAIQRIRKVGYIVPTTVIGTGQLGPITSSTVPTPVDQTSYTLDNSLGALSTVPLCNFPGTYCEYCTSYDIIGFFMDQIIKQTPALLSTYGDIIGYCKKTILEPIGVNDCWFNGGQSQPPVDASSNMMSASEVRFSSNGTSSGTTQYGGSAASGYGFDGSYNMVKFYDHNPGSSMAQVINNQYYIPFNSNLKHVGTFGGGAVMSVNSYGKVLQLFINKGWDVNSNRRILTKASINYLASATAPSGTQMVFIGDITAQSAGLSVFGIQPFTWAAGIAKVPEVWTAPTLLPAGLAANVQIISPSYPWAPECLYWNGSLNTFYYINMDTGNWMHFGTQQPSWANTTSFSSPTAPNTLALIRAVEGAISV